MISSKNHMTKIKKKVIHFLKNIKATSVGMCIYRENGKLTKNTNNDIEYAHHRGNSNA